MKTRTRHRTGSAASGSCPQLPLHTVKPVKALRVLVKSHTDRAAISGLLKADFRDVYGGLVLVRIALDDQAVIEDLVRAERDLTGRSKTRVIMRQQLCKIRKPAFTYSFT